MSNSQEAAMNNSTGANPVQQSLPAAPAENQQGQRQANQKGQRPARRPAPALSEQQRKLLDSLLTEKLSNPFAARELLTALQSPGARFVVMSNGMTNQIFRILGDTDRALGNLNRVTAQRVENLDARHACEKELASVMTKLAEVTADIATLAKMDPKQVLEPNVRALMKAKKGESADAGELKAA